ncbi:MAG: hypothetical protein M3R17_12750 [Bacteroidota bacterium]|nr:hypothetical protein [Bacteroidota bacterium]
MTQFNALAVIFDNVDVTINGKNIKDSLSLSPTKTKKDEAINGLKDFASHVNALNSNVTMSLTINDTPKTLRNLSLIKNGTKDSPFLHPADFEKAMQAAVPGFTLSWGQYDTIFIIVPANSSTGLTAQGWSVNGWGSYKPADMKGAAIAFIPSNYNMEEFHGQVFIHEWLHGVCHFYKMMGWTDKISGGDADDGGPLGYMSTTADGDLIYYKDLMNAQSKNKKVSGAPLTGTPGITNALWQAGSMRSDIRNLFKNQVFKNAYVSAGGQASIGHHISDIHIWEEGGQKAEIMDFNSPTGTSSIMRLSSDANAWYLPRAWWSKFLEKGKIGTLGAPISTVHAWSDGELVDFKKLDAKQCALMKPAYKNTNQIFYVPNNFWNKLVAVGGTPKIGYPQSEVHGWGSGQIIDFETKGGAASGIMKENNNSNVYLVKGLIWKAYVGTSGNGATSYLGYPTGDEYLWKDGFLGLFGTEYHRQNFRGGWCWASKTNPLKYGNDKNFKTNK